MTTKEKDRFVIDLFAGCGGLSLGLENAGFTPLLVNELADEARHSYLANRRQYAHFKDFEKSHYDEPERPWVWKDVKALRAHIDKNSAEFKKKVQETFGISIDDRELDLIVGGPPCQGYSGIGHRRSYAVDKKHIPSNHLYDDMIFLIDALKPRMFLFENVRGLLSARWEAGGEKGEIWKDVRAHFKKFLGGDYVMGWHLVRAKEYGVPQNRPRVLLAGIRRDLGWQPLADSLDDQDLLLKNDVYRAGGLLPDPDGEPPSLFELLEDLRDPNYEPGQKKTTAYPQDAASPKKGQEKSVQQQLRDPKDDREDDENEPTLTEHEYSRHSPTIVDKFQRMIDEGEIPAEYRTKKFAQRVLPEEWGDDGPTITATSLPDDYVHYYDPRILTVREWARLQMFPDWYQFKGKRTTGGLRRAGNPRENVFDREVPKYTQIGNAVPVPLAEAVGRHFMSLLLKAESQNSKKVREAAA